MEEEKKTGEMPGDESQDNSQAPPIVTRSMSESCESCSVEEPKIPVIMPDANWSTAKLIEATKDANMLVRSNAISLLAKKGPEEATEPLIQAMKDKEYIVKTNAMVSLASFGRGIVDRMIEALNDPEPDVRAGAAWVLGEFKDPKSIEGLEKVAKDEYPLARIQAKASLVAMGRGPKKEKKAEAEAEPKAEEPKAETAAEPEAQAAEEKKE
jgi:HEAT repeat protein